MGTGIRADHVGSLLRPDSLLNAREEAAAGRLPETDLEAMEDAAILEALAMQRGAGLQILSDGEYRRRSFLSELAAAVDGFTDGHSDMMWRGDETQSDMRSTSKIVGGKLRKRRRMARREAEFLREHAPGEFKITIPEISYFPLSSWQPSISGDAYPRREDLLPDLSAIVRDEIESLQGDGVSYVQLDSVGFTTLVDDRQRDWLAGTGTDPDAYVTAAASALQRCLAGLRRPGTTLAIHMCRGNSRNRWLASGGYDRIAPFVFPRVEVDRWLLEYDTERAGGFGPLRHMPDDVTVVLGLISTKTPVLESSDDLVRRIDEAARHVPIERLAISPQCGFASIAEGNKLSMDDQRRKLELAVETAARVWG